MEKKVIINELPSKSINQDDDDINALSNNKVGVDIDPDVKSNNVNIQMCSCSLIFNCFSPNKPETS